MYWVINSCIITGAAHFLVYVFCKTNHLSTSYCYVAFQNLISPTFPAYLKYLYKCLSLRSVYLISCKCFLFWCWVTGWIKWLHWETCWSLVLIINGKIFSQIFYKYLFCNSCHYLIQPSKFFHHLLQIKITVSQF